VQHRERRVLVEPELAASFRQRGGDEARVDEAAGGGHRDCGVHQAESLRCHGRAEVHLVAHEHVRSPAQRQVAQRGRALPRDRSREHRTDDPLFCCSVQRDQGTAGAGLEEGVPAGRVGRETGLFDNPSHGRLTAVHDLVTAPPNG